MRVRVTVKKGQLDYFRQLARNTPLEVQAYLVGEVMTPDDIRISSIEYTSAYVKQTPSTVQWSGEEYDRVVKIAEAREERVVGNIHSHPQYDSVMSPRDHEALVTEGHRVCGICSTNERKTRVRFWVAESSLSCKIVYA